MSGEQSAFGSGENSKPRPLHEAGSRASARARAQASALLKLVSHGATISTDRAGRIVTWSTAAEQLLGHRESAVRGIQLHEILQSRDVFGNRISCECGVRETLRRGEAVRRHVIDVTDSSGRPMRVVLLVQPQPTSSSANLVYEIRPDARNRQGDRRSSDRSRNFPGPIGDLSPAEQKVLKLLAAGTSPQDVASSLGVSLTTIRNHIQHLYRKLGVHTQAEAISMAFRGGLV